MAQAPQAIADLVRNFERKLDSYRRSDYKEAEVCSEFIEPFLEALGWDVHISLFALSRERPPLPHRRTDPMPSLNLRLFVS